MMAKRCTYGGIYVMLERVIDYIERHQLLPEQGKLLVAVSGGTDSLCLLHLLHQMCGPGRHFSGVRLEAAHLDHMLRGEASARDARLVEEQMQAWQIPLTLGQIDVMTLARVEKRSLEEAARVARYRFLNTVAQGSLIAVAHHADDQVETLLLHWLRGTGLHGMAGMAPRQQNIIRPLLEVTRAETEAYCQAHAILPLEDLSNSDPRFLRNRLRHEVIPLLLDVHPGIKQTLLRNAEVTRIDLAWLEMQVDQNWRQIVLSENETQIALDALALANLPLSPQRHLLRRATAHLCSGQSPLELRHHLLIEQLLQESHSRQARALHLPQQLHLLLQANRLLLERLPNFQAARSQQPETEVREVQCTIPGEVAVPGTSWLVRAEIVDEEQTRQVHAALLLGDQAMLRDLLPTNTPQSIYVDGEVAGPHLLVRTRRPGDRMQPLGMARDKKVQDIFVDAHVPRTERDSIPLLFSEAHCLWVAGICLDHRARLTRQTRLILHLSLRNILESAWGSPLG